MFGQREIEVVAVHLGVCEWQTVERVVGGHIVGVSMLDNRQRNGEFLDIFGNILVFFVFAGIVRETLHRVHHQILRSAVTEDFGNLLKVAEHLVVQRMLFAALPEILVVKLAVIHFFYIVDAAVGFVFFVVNAVKGIFQTHDAVAGVGHLVHQLVRPLEIDGLGVAILVYMDDLADRFVLVVGEIERVEAVDHDLLELFAFAVIDIDLVGVADIAEVPDLADLALAVIDFVIGFAREEGHDTEGRQNH